MDRSELFSSLKLDRFIAFDFETTGLQVETDRAIEVAAIMFKDGNAESTKVGAVSKSQLIEFVDEIIQ